MRGQLSGLVLGTRSFSPLSRCCRKFSQVHCQWGISQLPGGSGSKRSFRVRFLEMLIQCFWDPAWQFVCYKFLSEKSGKCLHWCHPGRFAQSHTESLPSLPCLLTLPPFSWKNVLRGHRGQWGVPSAGGTALVCAGHSACRAGFLQPGLVELQAELRVRWERCGVRGRGGSI